MSKTPEMTKALDAFSVGMFGRSRSECIKKGLCVVCGKPADKFTSIVSQTEYKISAMCQQCQNKVFGE